MKTTGLLPIIIKIRFHLENLSPPKNPKRKGALRFIIEPYIPRTFNGHGQVNIVGVEEGSIDRSTITRTAQFTCMFRVKISFSLSNFLRLHITDGGQRLFINRVGLPIVYL